MSRKLLFDVEGNGLLPKLTRLTCLVLKDPDTRETWRFRSCDASPAFEVSPITKGGQLFAVEAQENIGDGLTMLEQADMVIGHNIISFDIKALQKIHPGFRPRGIVRDTLTLTRLIMPDTYDGDMKLWNKGILPGKLIKSHSLDAWGYRVGLHKGDYASQMEALGKNPWASWNLDLEDYCANDVDVTEVLWAAIQAAMPPETSVEGEHDVHDLCSVLESNGFPFDYAAALELRDRLRSEYEKVSDVVKREYGFWYAPERKYRVNIEWDDPDGYNKKQRAADLLPDQPGKPPRKRKYFAPRPEFGEDLSRAWWADVTLPKKTMRFRTQVPEELRAPGFTHGTREEGAPYCKVERKEFNPNSRHDVINRFTQVSSWVPQEFTEKGNPEVNDGVLQGLISQIPMAEQVAECFFIKKYLGQIADGKQSWLNSYNPDTGCIHCYINVGGTVSGRCSHVGPNLGQVPAVVEADTLTKDARDQWKKINDPDARDRLVAEMLADRSNYQKNFNKNFLISGANGDLQLESYCFDDDGDLKDEAPLHGRAGDWGWECRSLFGVPPEFKQVGVDLSGIEFRCLAELTAPFDGGELISVILSGQDIHAYNQSKTGIPNRGVIKRCLYGLMYGAGDYKLGITADPTLTLFPDAAKRLGASIRGQIMAGLPALKKAIDLVKREAQRGYLIGLDGRKLGCRSEHSALNLRLQSNAALIAKRWLVLTEWYALDMGWDHSWDGDFAMLAFVHDEQQDAVKPEIAKPFSLVAIQAAKDAGLDFNFTCPVEAKAKIGQTWAQCH